MQLVDRLKVKYPVGTRIKLIRMDDPYTKLVPGDMGTVYGVDDAGQIMMHWDRGESLSLLPGIDDFRIVKPENMVEVVMCKDCKCMNIYEDGTWWCEELEREIIDPLWFCKYGERKEE